MKVQQEVGKMVAVLERLNFTILIELLALKHFYAS